MTDERNPLSGQYFDDFLDEQGIRADVDEAAVKRALAWRLQDEMTRQGLTRTTMAARMGTSRAQLNRLLNPNNESMTLATLKRAAAVVGKRIKIELVDGA